MTTLNLIFTLDYEIHGNGDGSPLKLMVEPTYRLMNLLEKYGFKLTILADTAEIFCFKKFAEETGNDKFSYKAIEKQLQEAITRGHDVQLHAHSSYFKATYNGSTWEQYWDEYNMAALSYERIDEIVKQSKEYLENLLKPIDKNYICHVFRAANWSMMPTHNIYNILINNGISIDTSVYKGGKQGGNVDYDYTNAFSNLYPYTANPQNINLYDPNGTLIEYPIYTEMRYFWSFVTPIRVFRMIRSTFHKHKKNVNTSTKESTNRLTLRSFFVKNPWKLDFNQASGTQIINALKRIKKRIKNQSTPVDIVLIGHSKTFVPYNETTLEKFLIWTQGQEDIAGSLFKKKQMMKKLILVAGARPNFMKIAPLMHALKGHPTIKPILVHTGQHYDITMSGQFFTELNIPHPDINLNVGSASHAIQTARIMEGFEKVCMDEKPDFVMVVGDVNSTLACSIVATKLNIPTIHYEAGLRSHDRTMPEEINRLVTDAISDLFFTTSIDANDNLIKEGILKEKIFMVGNLMIDSLVSNLQKAATSTLTVPLLNQDKTISLGKDFHKREYGVMTFHRPSNVDDKTSLEKLIIIWGEASLTIPLVFPIHPRTYKNIQTFGLQHLIESYPQLYFIEPLGYLQFINLVQHAKFVLTDSGGIQEETTYLNIPCLTVRSTTERPVTVWEGSNKLIQVEDILPEIDLIMAGKGKHGTIPQYWDGKAAERIINVIATI